MSSPLRVVRPGRRDWIFTEPDAKLAWRAGLPGALGYDAAAHELRRAAARGVHAHELLAMALPVSWMVNSKTTSLGFRAWLGADPRAAWAELLSVLGDGMAPEEWLATPSEERTRAALLVSALAGGPHGTTMCAVSKVLALFRPQLVPLMDDAALLFWLGPTEGLPDAPDADRPRAENGLFLPAIDAFARAVTAHGDALVAIAAAHGEAILDGAQALDRLVWVDTWGYRHNPSWWWVRDTDAEYILRLDRPRPGPGPIAVDELTSDERGGLAAVVGGIGP